jgi:hypothetical protein
MLPGGDDLDPDARDSVDQQASPDPAPLDAPPLGTMTCREFVLLVTEYLEGALTAEERARFEEHLALCEGCVDHVDHLRRTIAVAGTLTDEELSSEVAEGLLEAFRDWAVARSGGDG